MNPLKTIVLVFCETKIYFLQEHFWKTKEDPTHQQTLAHTFQIAILCFNLVISLKMNYLFFGYFFPDFEKNSRLFAKSESTKLLKTLVSSR